jgi:hypothetical protein
VARDGMERWPPWAMEDGCTWGGRGKEEKRVGRQLELKERRLLITSHRGNVRDTSSPELGQRGYY